MTFACYSCLPHRYLIAVLSFVGMLISVGYRTSFALMVTHIVYVNSSDSGSDDHKPFFPNCTVPGTGKDRVVNWSGSTTSLFHTSFFIGQFVMSIPAGALATKCSPKKTFSLTILMTSVLQMLIPVASLEQTWPIFLIRALQGIVEAISVPAMNAVISAWAHKSEKARLINIAYAGVYLSPAVAMFSTAATSCYVSWDSILYIYGALGAAWSIVFILVIASSPATHPRLPDRERQRLLRHGIPTTKASKSIREVPWCKFFTSMPVLAIWVAAFCRNFIFALLITEVQQYYKDVYQLPTGLNAVLSSIPHIFMVVFMLTGSCVFDLFIKRGWLSVTNTRKLAQCTGFGIQGACTLAVGFVDHYKPACILMCVGVAFSGFAISGYQTNPLDLAPRYAAPLTGISRTGMVGSVLSTLLASQLPGHSRSLIDWQHVFITAGAIHLGGVLFYAIFASGELQPWAQPASTGSESSAAAPEEANESHNSSINKSQEGATSDDGYDTPMLFGAAHDDGPALAVINENDSKGSFNAGVTNPVAPPNYGTISTPQHKL